MDGFSPIIFSCSHCNLKYKRHLPLGTKYSSCKRCGTLIDIERQKNESRYKREREIHDNNYQRHINEINHPFNFIERNNNYNFNDDPYNFDNYSGHDDYYKELGINFDNNNEENENEDYYSNNNNYRNNRNNNNHFFNLRNERIIKNIERRNNYSQRRNNNNNNIFNNFNNRFLNNNNMFNINIPNDNYNRNSGLRHASALFEFSENEDSDYEEINLEEYFQSVSTLLNDLNVDIQTLGSKIIKEKPKLKKLKMSKKLWVKNDKGKLEVPQCCICINNMKVNEEVVKLKCKHLFHFKCLDKWIENKQICPFCRTEIKTENIEKNKKNK